MEYVTEKDVNNVIIYKFKWCIYDIDLVSLYNIDLASLV